MSKNQTALDKLDETIREVMELRAKKERLTEQHIAAAQDRGQIKQEILDMKLEAAYLRGRSDERRTSRTIFEIVVISVLVAVAITALVMLLIMW